MVHFDPMAYAQPLKFKSAKSRRTVLVIGIPAMLLLLFMAYLFYSNEQTVGMYFVGLLYLIIDGMLVWMWLDTSYEIADSVLSYRSGIMQGKINIASIRKIEKKTEIFGGLKPALGSEGIIIQYNKFDDIYLSPENQAAFVHELKFRNPAIITKL